MRALRSSAGSTRWPLTTSVPSSMTACTCSGSTPGRATRMRNSLSVSSTSIGGSQLASRSPPADCSLKKWWRRRSARARESIASDSIQFTGSFVGISLLACFWFCGRLRYVIETPTKQENGRPASRTGRFCARTRDNSRSDLHRRADAPSESDQESRTRARSFVQYDAGDGHHRSHGGKESAGGAEQFHRVRSGAEPVPQRQVHPVIAGGGRQVDAEIESGGAINHHHQHGTG